MGRTHKKDIGLLKLDQQTPAVQLLPITSSLEAAEVDESLLVCRGQLSLVWSHLWTTGSACSFTAKKYSFFPDPAALDKQLFSLQIILWCF